MSNNKTAIQQLIDRLKRDIDYFNSLLKEQVYVEMKISTMAKITQTEHILKYVEDMLEMEKKQIEDACQNGFYCGNDIANATKPEFESAEQYYNETYRGDTIQNEQ